MSMTHIAQMRNQWCILFQHRECSWVLASSSIDQLNACPCQHLNSAEHLTDLVLFFTTMNWITMLLIRKEIFNLVQVSFWIKVSWRLSGRCTCIVCWVCFFTNSITLVKKIWTSGPIWWKQRPTNNQGLFNEYVHE